jgi:hypothetical protein
LDALEESLQMFDGFFEEARKQDVNTRQFEQRKESGLNEIWRLNIALQQGATQLRFLNFPESSQYFQLLIKLQNDSNRILSDVAPKLCTNIQAWQSLRNEEGALLYDNAPEIASVVEEREIQLTSNDHEYYGLKQETTHVLNVIDLIYELRQRLKELERIQKPDDTALAEDDESSEDGSNTNSVDGIVVLENMISTVTGVLLYIDMDNPAASASFVTHSIDLLRLYAEIEALKDKIKLLTDGLVAEHSNLERM